MGQSRSVDRHAWEDAFIAGLHEFGMVKRAASAAGRTTGAAYGRRNRSPAFRQAWDDALAQYRRSSAKVVRNSAARPARLQLRRAILEALAEKSNVAASAHQAGIPSREVYRLRRTDNGFAAEWRAALFEGFANLEMEVLCYLRDPAPERKMDVASALRLLTAHKDTIAAERATRAHVSAAEVRASIERKVEIFRQQVVAEQERKARDRD